MHEWPHFQLNKWASRRVFGGFKKYFLVPQTKVLKGFFKCHFKRFNNTLINIIYNYVWTAFGHLLPKLGCTLASAFLCCTRWDDFLTKSWSTIINDLTVQKVKLEKIQFGNMWIHLKMHLHCTIKAGAGKVSALHKNKQVIRWRNPLYQYQMYATFRISFTILNFILERGLWHLAWVLE